MSTETLLEFTTSAIYGVVKEFTTETVQCLYDVVKIVSN